MVDWGRWEWNEKGQEEFWPPKQGRQLAVGIWNSITINKGGYFYDVGDPVLYVW